MSNALVSDELWALVAPQLPPERRKPKGGRPRVPDRTRLTGIIFVVKSGIPWEMQRQEMGNGSGVAHCHRSCEWQATGSKRWSASRRWMPSRQSSGPRRPVQAPAQAACRQGLRSRCRQALRRWHIQVRIARKGLDASQRLGRNHWVIERTLAWLNRYSRLTVRYERRADIHQSVLALGCCLNCLHALPTGF